MWRELLTKDEACADIGVFGIAVDTNCSIKTGARNAPKRLRKNSEYLPPFTVSGEEICAKIFDYGDVKSFNQEKINALLDKTLKKPFTLVLGGDHSISILTQKAFKEQKKGRIGLIHIDAHADICDVYQGSRYSHACVNRRALEHGYAEEDITMLGIRSLERQEAEFLPKSNITLYTVERMLSIGIDNVIKEVIKKYEDYDDVYLSFDIDAVDPAYAPGTGTPEAFGLTAKDVLHLLSDIIKVLPVSLMDIVEISPPLDMNDITVWLALKYILEIFHIIKSKQK